MIDHETKSLEALIKDIKTDPCDQTFKSLYYRALSLVADMQWKDLSYMNMRLLMVDKDTIDSEYVSHFEILTDTIQKFQTHTSVGLNLYEDTMQVVNDEDLHALLLALNHSGSMEYDDFKRKVSGMSCLQHSVTRAEAQGLIQITQSDKVRSIRLTLKGRKTLTIIQNNRNDTDG